MPPRGGNPANNSPLPALTNPDNNLTGGKNQIEWVQVGATIDPTAGQTAFNNHGGMSFAELLQAGKNQGLHPTLTEVLGEQGGPNGMPMETAILIKMPRDPDSKLKVIYKNDVGSGQPGNPHYKIDLHPGIAAALGWLPNQDVMVGNTSQAKNALTQGAASGGAIQNAVNAVGSTIGDIGSTIGDIGKVFSFIFSFSFLYVIGGFVLLLLALMMIWHSSGRK